MIIATCAALPLLSEAETYRHDFGTIREDRGPVSHVFTLDAAPAPFAIVKVLPGCPCVKADCPKTPAKKGEKMKVTLRYDPARQNRHFTKSVYLRRSDGKRDTLTVTGTVIATSEPYDRRKYSADFGMGLRLTTPRIDAGTLRRGLAKTVTVDMINSYEAGMNLDLLPAGRDAAMLTIPCGLRLPPMKEAKIRIVISVPADARPGKLEAKLQPTVNGRTIDPIPVTGTIR